MTMVTDIAVAVMSEVVQTQVLPSVSLVLFSVVPLCLAGVDWEQSSEVVALL